MATIISRKCVLANWRTFISRNLLIVRQFHRKRDCGGLYLDWKSCYRVHTRLNSVQDDSMGISEGNSRDPCVPSEPGWCQNLWSDHTSGRPVEKLQAVPPLLPCTCQISIKIQSCIWLSAQARTPSRSKESSHSVDFLRGLPYRVAQKCHLILSPLEIYPWS